VTFAKYDEIEENAQPVTFIDKWPDFCRDICQIVAPCFQAQNVLGKNRSGVHARRRMIDGGQRAPRFSLRILCPCKVPPLTNGARVRRAFGQKNGPSVFEANCYSATSNAQETPGAE
jgi:hypothetical protein